MAWYVCRYARLTAHPRTRRSAACLGRCCKGAARCWSTDWAECIRPHSCASGDDWAERRTGSETPATSAAQGWQRREVLKRKERQIARCAWWARASAGPVQAVQAVRSRVVRLAALVRRVAVGVAVGARRVVARAAVHAAVHLSNARAVVRRLRSDQGKPFRSPILGRSPGSVRRSLAPRLHARRAQDQLSAAGEGGTGGGKVEGAWRAAAGL